MALDFDTNFHGVLHMARAFRPVLRERDGAAIVNMLTMLSVASMPAMGGYSASKAAAWSLTMSLRASLASEGIAVHGVFPGAVDTDMLEGVEMPKTSPDEVAQNILAGIEEGQEDISPDPMSRQLWELFLENPKAVEQQFASM